MAELCGGRTVPEQTSTTATSSESSFERRLLISLVVAGVLAATAVLLVIPRNTFLTGLAERSFPGLISGRSLVRNLESNDQDLVRESLYLLTRRKDPVGVPQALKLLKSDDDYIWLNAALYTGACGQQEAVPYLIKALRHTAWRADPKTAGGSPPRVVPGLAPGTDRRGVPLGTAPLGQNPSRLDHIARRCRPASYQAMGHAILTQAQIDE